MRNFFYDFPRNILRCFWGYNLLWHALAIALTYFCVTSGFDWFYFEATRNPLFRTLFFPALMLGSLFPFLVPFVFYGFGKIKNNEKIVSLAYAIGQAALLGSLISSLYKAFTGRIPPVFHNTLANILLMDMSHGFRFGFLRGGIFWGWPSSHTTIAFAMATAFFILASKEGKAKYIALLYALYVGLGVSVTIHWFSEFMAGAIIGTVIGAVVGKSFLKRIQA